MLILIQLHMYTDADTQHQHKVGLGEVELFTRTQQYVPGAMVMAIAAKSEDVSLIDGLNAQCCRNAIRCPPGSYCLAGAAHGDVFSYKQAEAYAATGGKDFEAPQTGIAGNYYSAGSEEPLGSGQCPKGYYCPAGSAVPRPCWRGWSCAGQGVVKPTVCPTGSYGNVGVPAYTYDWEQYWPIEEPARVLMSNDLALMYYDAMRKVIQDEQQQQLQEQLQEQLQLQPQEGDSLGPVLPMKLSRFWNGQLLEDFPDKSWSLVQGFGGGFADGVRSVLLDKGTPLRSNYTFEIEQVIHCMQYYYYYYYYYYY
jgi:hypothetical protein